MPPMTSAAAAPASACARCRSVDNMRTRRPSSDVAMTIGGTASSVSNVRGTDV